MGVTETQDSLGRVVLGRDIAADSKEQLEKLKTAPLKEMDRYTDETTKRGCYVPKGYKGGKPEKCVFQLIDLHLPFGYGVRVPGNTIHGDSATMGRIVTPIDLLD